MPSFHHREAAARANEIVDLHQTLENLDRFEIRRNRVGEDFAVKLLAQNDNVFKVPGRDRLVGTSVVPDLRFAKKREAGEMDHTSSRHLRISTEKDRCSKNAFKSSNQPSIFFTAFMHSEDVEHFGRTPEADRLTLLLHGESRQKDRHDAILAEW